MDTTLASVCARTRSLSAIFTAVALAFVLIAAPLHAASVTDSPVADSRQSAPRSTTDRPSVVARAGGIAYPGLGALLGVDTRLVSDLYVGMEGGGFDGPVYGQWFVGARASYRLRVTPSVDLVPSVGLSHVGVVEKDVGALAIVGQNPISPTAGLELDLWLGPLLVGAQATFMPVQLASDARDERARGPGTRRSQALYDAPLALFAGVAF